MHCLAICWPYNGLAITRAACRKVLAGPQQCKICGISSGEETGGGIISVLASDRFDVTRQFADNELVEINLSAGVVNIDTD